MALRRIGATIHEAGLSTDRIIDAYNKIADVYDTDVMECDYLAPKVTAEVVSELIPTGREAAQVLDVACGTGLVGEELVKLGFREIDGHDPSKGMIDIANRKNVYRQTTCIGLSSEPLAVDEGTYDVVCICGFNGTPDPLCQGLPDLIRITKTGGHVVFILRKAYYELPEYQEKFKTKCEELEQKGVVQIRSRLFDGYHPGVTGLVLSLKKC